MIKRIVFALLLAIVPGMAFAQPADRDVLLTADGTLYTIESVFSTDGDPSVQTASSKYLLLTVQQANRATTMVVPGSLRAGLHYNPTLAYDSDSNTLFMFWESAANTTRNATSLEFCSYQNGKWSETTELDAARWRLRHNLRIAVTHKTEDRDTDGHPLISELTVHAIWWEESGYSEWARYAMLTIDKGNVSQIQIHDMAEFIDPKLPAVAAATPAPGFSTEILRHPQVFESNTHTAVDIIFGDLTTSGFHRITLQPVVNLRVRIPVGVRDQPFTGPHFPTTDSASLQSREFSAIPGDKDRLVFYSVTPNQMQYSMYHDNNWTTLRTITLNDKVTNSVALSAIGRMMASE
ncbi:MAG: hypothetical protein ABI837_03320 [Acidobacteriota bacterium]